MSLQDKTNKQAEVGAAIEKIKKKEAPIDRETRLAMMKFFLRTSGPRILRAQKELAGASSDTGEEL